MFNPVKRAGLAHTDRAIKSVRGSLPNSSEFRALPIRLQNFVNSQLTDNPQVNSRTPCSVLSAQRNSAAALLGVVQLYFNDLLGKAPEPYLVTFAYQSGEVPMGHTLRNVQTSIIKARDALIAHEMDGILTPDVDLIMPLSEASPLIAFHLHGIVFSVRSSQRVLRLENTAKKMDAAIGLPSRLPRGCHLSGKRDRDFRIHVENMSTYAAKFVAALKVETVESGKSNYSRDRSLFTPRHALNLLYAWSQIPVLKSVIAVGEQGKMLHKKWLRDVKASRFSRDLEHYNDTNSAELWQEVIASVNSGNIVRAGL